MKLGVFKSVKGGAQRFVTAAEKYKGELVVETIDFEPTDDNSSRVVGYDAILFVPGTPVTEIFWKNIAQNGVKYVLTCSAGFDHFDIETMKKYGIKGANAAFYSPNSVAEFTTLSILALLREYRKQIKMVEEFDYRITNLLGKEVRNQNIGIVGAGRIGYTTMQCLTGFGPKKIYAYDVYQNDKVKELAEYVSLEEIYEKCDVIAFHCNYTQENHHMVNDESISKMKDGVMLVNVARGGLFDTAAVLKGVKSGKIGGVALDVLEDEFILKDSKFEGACPLAELDELLKYDNVIYTNHTAFLTDQSLADMNEITIDNLYEYKMTGNCKNEVVK